MSGSYQDIIHLPHPTSAKHTRMPARDRAAQFSPFAALTGYDAAVKETARLTDRRLELDEHEKEALNDRLLLLSEHLLEKPVIEVTYFSPDERKAGGAYVTATGAIKKIDLVRRELVRWQGAVIPIDEIVGIEGDLFRTLE